MMRLFTPIDSSYAGAYALNALGPREQRAFERAMDRSHSLREEVVELQDTAVLLSEQIEPVQPPAALRERLLAQIELTPQLAPEPEPVQREHRPSLGERLERMRAVLVPATVGFAAVAVAVAVILPMQQPVSPNEQAINTVLQAEDMHQASNVTPQGSTLTVAWSPEHGRAVASMKGGYPLPSNKTYELWVTDKSGNTHSAGLITNQHTSPVLLPGKVGKGVTMRITVEPVKGSDYPTTKPLFAMKM
jgi:anti-sigma-K factor RskA